MTCIGGRPPRSSTHWSWSWCVSVAQVPWPPPPLARGPEGGQDVAARVGVAVLEDEAGWAPLQSSGQDSACRSTRGGATAAAARTLAVADPLVDHVRKVAAAHAAVGRDGVLGSRVELVDGDDLGAAVDSDARAPHGARGGRHAALARRREARVAVREDGVDAARAVVVAPAGDEAPEALAALRRRALGAEVLRRGVRREG